MAREERARDPERRLVEAAQADPSRFADLYELHFDRIYAFIARRVRDRGETEDLTSEVFHRALASLGKFEWRGTPFAAWLYRIAQNAIADRARRKTLDPAPPEPADLIDPAMPAEEEMAQAEKLAELYRSVTGLPPDQRKVILLRFAEEKSIREIAGELQRSEGAVKQLQVRAIENLRARMEEAYG
jgi:RNA polymerase sigma-70 factor (ECF subfamily)